MKTLFSFILLITVSLIFPSKLHSQDQLLGNFYTPDNNSQASPHCIAYNDSNENLYVYTGQKIIVVDKATGVKEDQIIVGQTGYYVSYKATTEKTHKLAFDGNRNYLYCANEDNELIVIDCSTNLKINTLTSPFALLGSFIYFNPGTDMLYWVQNRIDDGGSSQLVAYEASNLTTPTGIIQTVPYSTFKFSDMVFCHQDDYICVAQSITGFSPQGSLLLLDPYTLSKFDEIQYNDHKIIKIAYITEKNRLYCLKTNSSGSQLDAYIISVENNQLIYSSAFSITDFPLLSCVSMCYSDTYHYAYFTGKLIQANEVVIIDCDNTTSPIIEELPLSGVNHVLYSPLTDRVFCAGETLCKINGDQIEQSASIHGLANHLIEAGDQLAISDIEGNTLQIYSSAPVKTHQIQLGDNILKGILNPTWQKIYWISNASQNQESFVSIQNLINNSITTVQVGPGIKDITYHNGSEKLVVANWDWSESQLTIVDGQSDVPIVVESDQFNLMQAGENNSTYLGGANQLCYLDMTNNSIEPISNIFNTPYFIWDFTVLNNGNCVALVVENGIYGCKLVEIDRNTNQITSYHSFQFLPHELEGLFYNKLKNQFYLVSDFSITIINAETYQIISTVYPPVNELFSSCTYSSGSDRIFVNNGSNNKILVYDGTSFGLLDQIVLDSYEFIISFVHNSMNDMVYLHVMKYDAIFTNDNELRIKSYRASDLQMTGDLYLGQNCMKLLWVYAPGEKMVLNESGSFLYVPNQGLGNISVVQCSSDQIPLKGDWSWISFPRLERDPLLNLSVPAETALNYRIKPGPDNQYTGTMQYLQFDEAYPENEHMINIKKVSTFYPWDPATGDLHDVSSTQGFQIHLTPGQQYIELYGEVQDPSLPVELHANFENWVGYFLPHAQHPVSAIPLATLDNIAWMAGQYWFCVNEKPYPDGSGGLWRCACSEGDLSVKYGDMIKLYSRTNDNFYWQLNTPVGPGIDKPPSALFSFEEQANYEALFIELDSTNLPDEIGAIVNDTCIGATKVFPEDDTVLICAYTERFEGEEISFQFAYNTKTTNTPVDDYYVLNPRTGIRENRRIRVGEKQPYYFISLKENKNQVFIQPAGWVKCHPNPASAEVTIDCFIDRESKVHLTIMNTLGVECLSRNLGMKSPGHFQCNLSLDAIPAGYYLLKMTAGNLIMTDKLCVVK